MSALLKGGIPIGRSLDLLSRQEEDRKFRAVVTDVRRMIEHGQPLSRALARSPANFPKTYIAAVQAGENSGMLVECLETINAFLEKEDALIKKVKGTLTYPVIMLSVSIGLVFAIVKFVFPIFLKMFDQTHASLPLITLAVMGMVRLSQSLLSWFIGGAFLLSLLCLRWVLNRSEAWLLELDRLKLSLPVFGDLYVKIACARFCRTLASLYGNGVPIRKCLNLSAEVVGNRIFAREIHRAEEELSTGTRIFESLQKGGLFPRPVVQMMAVGEGTGALIKVLQKISDFYDAEVDRTLETLTSLLEPAILIFLGTVMGTFMVSIFLPLYQMMGGMGG